MARCEIHCPGGGAAVASAAVIALGAGVFAVAEFTVEYAWVLIPGVVVMGAVVYGLQRFLLARTVVAWRKPQAVLPVALEARPAPLAIEAPRRAVYVISDVQESSVKEQW